MNVRLMWDSDIPILERWQKESGFAYEMPDLKGPLIEQVYVVELDGEIVMACAAERILQLYLFAAEGVHPAAKLRAIKQLHETMAIALKERGYSEVNCFVPPQAEKSFGSRLMRTFGWVRNWTSFAKRF